MADARARTWGTGGWRIVVVGLLGAGLLVGCDGCGKAAPSGRSDVAPQCQGKCRIMGLCSWDDATQECAAASERDCADSDICKTSGICGFVEGKCVARNDADCRGSEQCQERGMCHFDADLQPPCGAGSDEDCAASSRCRQLGACTARLRKCVVADGDCRKSQACIVHGRCSEHTSDDATRCVAGSNADCKDSTDCTDRGLCLAKDGVCI